MSGRELEERWGVELEIESKQTSEICLVQDLEVWMELELEMESEKHWNVSWGCGRIQCPDGRLGSRYQ